MEKKPYSDRRWWEAPKAFDSACNSCTRYHGYAKCDTYPDGIPEFPIVKDTTPNMMNPRLYTTSYNKP